MLEITNEDCMDLMARYDDNHFDLAIVDPPYGIGNFQQSDGNFKPVGWNEEIPNKNYFQELERVSKEQIIWGANYFNCFNGKKGAIIWDKLNMHPSMSRCEIASCSLQKRITYFNYEWHGFVIKRIDEKSYHPCQKPVKLYEWLLKNYAKEGDKILDTHLGSGSIAIACHYAGYDLTACELDKEYYDQAMERIKNQTRQIKLIN